MSKTKEWKPSEETQDKVIAELLGVSGPLRLRDLLQKSEGQLSKVSVVKALAELSKRGIVIREKYGRKRVEFRLNIEHPEIKRIVERIARLKMQMDSVIKYHQAIIDAQKQLLSSLPKGTEKNRIIKAITFGHISSQAVAFTIATFEEANSESRYGESQLEHDVMTEFMSRFSPVQKQGLIDAIKADRHAARKALADWLRMSETALNRAMGRVPYPRISQLVTKEASG